MPKKLATKDRGRKMIVTMVKTRMALPWSSRRLVGKAGFCQSDG
jgi:hypothetical protein